MSGNRFSHSEASDLLAKAARLEALAGRGDETTLTLEEVREAAQAAGIDPSWVDQALVSDPALPEPKRAFGMTGSSHQVRVLRHRVDQDEWGKMVLALRRRMGQQGTAESIGDTHTWTLAYTRVTVENTAKGAIIRADIDWSGEVKVLTVMGVFMMVFTLAFTALLFVTKDKLAWGASLLLFLTSLVIAMLPQLTHRNRSAKIEAQLGPALDEMERIASQTEAVTHRSHRATAAPALSLDDLPEPEERERQAERNRVR